MSVHLLYDHDVRERIVVALNPTLALLRWGTDDSPANWGFEHTCKTWDDDQEPDGVFVKVVAPRLTNHTVTRGDNGITVRASIACPDCGAHGFVTDSTWKAA